MAERILIIDDEYRILNTLEEYFTDSGYEVATAATGQSGLEEVHRFNPALVLLDLRLPDMDGMALLYELRAADPFVGVVMITGHGDVDSAVRAMQAGAVGYLVKGASARELAEAIRVAHGGQTILSQEATQALTQLDEPSAELGNDLTERELEVLALLARGSSNAEIAQQLVISTSTASHHVRSIRSKLGAANRAEAAALAMQHGLIQTPT